MDGAVRSGERAAAEVLGRSEPTRRAARLRPMAEKSSEGKRRRLLRSRQDPDGGVERDGFRAGREPPGLRAPPPARQVGLGSLALPAARLLRRADERGPRGRQADLRRDPRARGRADGPGGPGRDPAADLPADARRGPPPPGRGPRHLHRQRRRQRPGRRRSPGCSAWRAGSGPAGRSAPTATSPARWMGPSSTARARSRRCGASPTSTTSTWPPPTPTPTRRAICRCCAPSATRSSSTPMAALAEIARAEGWQVMRFEKLGRQAGDRRRHRAGGSRRRALQRVASQSAEQPP